MVRFRASVSSAAAQHRLLFLRQEISPELQEAIDTLARRAEFVFMAYAPRGRYSRGTIRESIRASSGQSTSSAGSFGRRFSSARALAITAEARGRTGYDYVGVSRFGHLEDPIVPKRGPVLVISNRHGWVGKWSGPSVRGYHPDRDWAEDAAYVAEQEAYTINDQLARELERNS